MEARIDRAHILGLAERVLRLEGESVLALCARLDDRFVEAVAALHRCRGRVIVTGMGKSGLIGRKIAATLASTGTPAYFLHPAEGVHGDLGMVHPDDVALSCGDGFVNHREASARRIALVLSYRFQGRRYHVQDCGSASFILANI